MCSWFLRSLCIGVKQAAGFVFVSWDIYCLKVHFDLGNLKNTHKTMHLPPPIFVWHLNMINNSHSQALQGLMLHSYGFFQVELQEEGWLQAFLQLWAERTLRGSCAVKQHSVFSHSVTLQGFDLLDKGVGFHNLKGPPALIYYDSVTCGWFGFLLCRFGT